MSKSKILKKILAVGLSIMSCIPAVGANGSNNEEPPKVQIKNESKDNSRPVSIKKTIAVGTFVTVLTLLSGYGGIKLSD